MLTKTDSIHLAIIPDGNRRWARSNKKAPWDGHRQGLANARTLIDWCYNDPTVSALTLWGFSTDNWKRDEKEVHQLMKLFEDFLQRELPELHKKNTRFVHSGRTDRFPDSLHSLISSAQSETEEYESFTLHIALDYSGRDELMRACSRLGDPQEGSGRERTLASVLDQPSLPDIDIIIRTSGEHRLSNFFLWQAAYAELFFLDKHFPELQPADLETVLQQFEQRHRRFGS